jgi:lysophospholipase L1-like esterase
MTGARSSIVKACGYVLIAAMVYLSLCPGVYFVSAVLLVRGIVLQPTLLRDFQRDFYFDRGGRTIWQTQKDCVQPDERLIYVPRIGSCRFTNAEFDTSLHFDIEGRVRNSMSEKLSEAGIALLGDSYAMGWGVNDSETFANVLQDELKRPVYNLAVSSYGTMRELLRLEQSGLIDQVDTILIQYSANDVGENAALDDQEKFRQAQALYGEMFEKGSSSNDHGRLESIRRAVSFSIEKPIRNLRDLFLPRHRRNQFGPHYESLLPVLKRFAPLLDRKRVIVFSVDEPRFEDFPSGRDQTMGNVEFADMKLDAENYYLIDRHLNARGHAWVGHLLAAVLSKPVVALRGSQ